MLVKGCKVLPKKRLTKVTPSIREGRSTLKDFSYMIGHIKRVCEDESRLSFHDPSIYGLLITERVVVMHDNFKQLNIL